MPSITDIPIEIFIDNIFPLLPLANLLRLGTTNRFFYLLTADETFWKRKIEQDYNFPSSETARNTGWRFLYKRLANPKVYVWGYVPFMQHPRIGLNPTLILARVPKEDSVFLKPSYQRLSFKVVCPSQSLCVSQVCAWSP